MSHEPNSNTDTYWCIIRNGPERHGYVEISHLGGDKWAVVLDDREFTIKSTARDFYELLEVALSKR